MDYERIHNKPQTGIISPSKLRARLMGLSPTKKKEGSNSHSSRTSPARAEDSEFLKNSLLASTSQDFDDTENQNHCRVKDIKDAEHIKVLQAGRADSGHSSTVHPLKSNDDENLDYDSNASSSSFEFHKGERMAQRTLTRSLSRPTSYKWNDAEKWIMNKQLSQGINSKSHNVQNGGNRVLGMNMVRVAPDVASSYDFRLHPRMPEVKRPDSCQPIDNFNMAPSGIEPSPIDLFPLSKDLKEVSTANSALDAPSTPAIRAISMRDMGTEMTPATSQEPSRTATPVGATTPLRSPTSSIPSTPRAGEPANTPMDYPLNSNTRHVTEKSSKELTEEEMKLKTRREIVALGVQLGKMNIAAWASKDDIAKNLSATEMAESEELERIEYENRAMAWEEAEKSKHAARYKRDEIRIQAWESQQKAKLEEELRRIEAKVERLRTDSQAKMMKKIAIARKRSEEKRAAAEAEKRRQAEKTSAQAEYIRQTGRIPSNDFVCCGLFS
ncbi:uncharacterized protein LOC141592721 isoform X2 [Silene latifolia]|uniref:uncharacterized protein LOC141592721 isoform X2 n=1 Tax=Silene latifolia TaxID=37657 RepID=UPI003D78AEC4